MKSEELRELWLSLGAVEDWLAGGPRSERAEPDFAAAEGAFAAAAERAARAAVRGPGRGAAAGGGSAGPAAAGAEAASGQDAAEALDEIAAEVRACSACDLAERRAKAVPGVGVARPAVLVVGEGPGAEEDARGEPFVGPAGRLLDKMLASIGLSRGSNCFIANVVKCRPPNNRDPLPAERDACMGYLRRQIAVLRPRAILCVGRIAASSLLGGAEGIGRLRGRWHAFEGIPLVATYHPSALLRDESLKRPAWEDLKLLRAFLETAPPADG